MKLIKDDTDDRVVVVVVVVVKSHIICLRKKISFRSKVISYKVEFVLVETSCKLSVM